MLAIWNKMGAAAMVGAESKKAFAHDVVTMGLGCMGLSGVYGKGHSDDAFIKFIKYALSEGIRFFDTADVYDEGHNESLLGKAIKQFIRENPSISRESITILTKVGYRERFSGFDFSPAHIHEACERSLKNLFPGSDIADPNVYIDVYCLHRMPKESEWEACLQALTELVASKKIRYIALSEPSSRFIRYAFSYFGKKFPDNNPLAAVEAKLSIFSPGPLFMNPLDPARDRAIVDICSELGLVFIPYGALEHGLLTMSFRPDTSFAPSDLRAVIPRFTGPMYQENLKLRDRLKPLAEQADCTLPQFALAWVVAQVRQKDCRIALIPGVSASERLIEAKESLNFVAKLSTPDASGRTLLDHVKEIAPHGAYGDRQPLGWREKDNIPKSPINTLSVFFADTAAAAGQKPEEHSTFHAS